MDPDTFEYHYIGQSVNPESRHRQHIIGENRHMQTPNRKRDWSKKLDLENKAPLLSILFSFEQDSAAFYWEAFFYECFNASYILYNEKTINKHLPYFNYRKKAQSN